MSKSNVPMLPFGTMPTAIRVLVVSQRQGKLLARWLGAATTVSVSVDVETLPAALARLRVENYDVLVLCHEPADWDALATVGVVRSVTPRQPIVVVGDCPAEAFTADCLEVGADAYVYLPTKQLRTVLWVLARAIERQALCEESQTLCRGLHAQQRQHQQSVLCQLRAQKSLLLEFAGTESHPPRWLKEHLLSLLRVYVVSGHGSPKDEAAQLVDTLIRSQVTLPEVLLAHTVATEELVLGLGQRPGWHVVGRANLMAYELVMQMRQATANADERVLHASS